MTMENAVSSRYLVVGLGNPGRRYREDRHNIGFMVLDHFLKRMDLTFSRSQQNALLADGNVNEQKVYFAKPQTFMNAVGTAVGPLSRYLRIPLEHLLVIYDDLDIPLGTIRMRPHGGSGGHRGMESILQHVGSDCFPRMRLGIGRPPGQMDPAAYVLQSFSKDEMEVVNIILEKAVDAVEMVIQEGIEVAMTRFNTSI